MLGKNTVDKQHGVIITKGSQKSKRQTKLPTKTAVVNAQKKLGKNQSDSDSDFEDNLTLSEIANIIRIESSDSEFEECLPLCELVEVRKNDNGKHKRYYTRKRMNTKQFQPSNLEHKQLLLSDYEDTCKVDGLDGIAPLKSPNVNTYATDRNLYWNEIYLEIISKPSFEQLKSYINGMSCHFHK